MDEVARTEKAVNWWARAYNESRIGNYEKAILCYTKAIELKPDYADAYNNRGFMYNNMNKREKALNDLNKAIKLEPENAFAYNNRGIAYPGLKEYEKAIKDYYKVIELNPKLVNVYSNLTELYIIIGRYDNAMKTIGEAMTLSRTDEEKVRNLYLECIAKKMLDIDVSDCENEFNEYLKKDIEIRWLFEPIESWLKDVDTAIEKDKKAFIIEKTEQLKKHKV